MYSAACHVPAGGRSLCGDRTNGRPGLPGSGANHCLLVSFPLFSELLSRTAPTGRKEEGRGVVGGLRRWGLGVLGEEEGGAAGKGKPGVQQAVGELVGFGGKERAEKRQEFA